MADTLSELSGHLPTDPDAQAAVTDFIDYTEFFPSDLLRSLALIGKLDETFLQHASHVHELTKTYGSLPNLPTNARPNAERVRKDISLALHHALQCRESSFAEAARLFTVADNLTNRICTIKRKLQMLPRPPSRDPTPLPKSNSPAAQRKGKLENDRTPRIKFKADARMVAPGDGFEQNVKQKKHRSRRIVVPGEVLPPYDPNSPGVTDDSDSEQEQRPATLPRVREKTPKLHKPLKLPKSQQVKIPKSTVPRMPGSSGTNVHSIVAGISVSNAMAQLIPPPSDPQPGSKHAPWLSLTEWELNKIRKRMKKNADWLPSDIMVKRELEASGRGLANYEKAKAHAAESGSELLDEEPEDFKRPLSLKKRMSEPASIIEVEQQPAKQSVNRSIKVNDAKNLQKQLLLQEAAEREEANRRITQMGVAINDLFSENPLGILGDSGPTNNRRTPSRRERKRKRFSSPNGDSSPKSFSTENVGILKQSMSKKIKLATPAPNDHVTATAAAQAESIVDDPHLIDSPHDDSSTIPKKAIESTDTQSSGQETGIAKISETHSDSTKIQAPTNIKLKLNTVKKPDAEPPTRRESLRSDKQNELRNNSIGTEKSTPTSKVATPAPDTLAGRRSRRNATETSSSSVKSGSSDRGVKNTNVKAARKGSAEAKAIKNGSHTAAISSGQGSSASKSNEETYCICNGPSSGRMIACDDAHCKIEWFHLECVGLDPNKGKSYSRATWYCPDCRGKHGVKGNGIAGS